MKALIIYDSFFDNTKKIAVEIGRVLAASGEVNVEKVSDSSNTLLKEIDLLVLGSPTRAFTYSPNIRRFLKSIPPQGLSGIKVCTFDTRIASNEKTPAFLRTLMKIFGYAAEPMLKSLINKGGTQVTPPAWFIVSDAEGPLLDGELEHAAAWAQEIISS